ncbi:MAG: DnaJ domain-containing protein [Cyclobacteriaceae bacterium]
MKNYYHVLGVDYDVSAVELKLAYRNLAKKYHPDANRGDTEKEEMFKLISEAYQVLSDTQKKASYDLSLLLGLHEIQEEYDRRYYAGRRRRPAYDPYHPPRRPEPVTYSARAYAAVSAIVVLIISAILLVPFTLAHYSSVYHYDKGIEYYQQKQYYAALNSLQHAIIDFGSKDIEACLLSGNILLEEFGQYSYALEYANLGLERATTPLERVQLLYLKGKCLQSTADYHNALAQYEEAIMLWPEYDSLYYEIGHIYAFHLGDFKKGRKVFSKLLSLNQNFTEALFARAYCEYHLEHYDRAQRDIDTYLERVSNDGEAYLTQAKIADKMNNPDQACEAIKKASLYDVQEARWSAVNYYCK